MEPPQTPKDFFDFLKKERDDSLNFRDEMNRDLSEKRIIGLRDRRQFLQNIILASVTLLGLISALATIGGAEKIAHPYFLTGIGFHLILICFATIYIRESIDQDNEGLLKMQDRYGATLQNKVNLIDKYLETFGEKVKNITKSLEDYYEELKHLETSRELVEENRKLDSEREERRKGVVLMEFNGEIIVFLFVGGTSLIFLSLTGYVLSLQHLSIIFFFLFFIIFTDFVTKTTKPVFKILTFLTKKDILRKK